MLIDKISRHLYRKNLDDDSYTIIDPIMYLDDVYTDLTLQESISKELQELYDKIISLDTVITTGAPVTSVANKTGGVVLTKADIIPSLSYVDNVPDTEKQPSSYLRKLVDQKHDEIYADYQNILDDVVDYKNHVTWENGSPRTDNPHKVRLPQVYFDDMMCGLETKQLISKLSFDKISIQPHNISQESHQPIIDFERTISNDLDSLVSESSNIVPTIVNVVHEQTPPILQEHNNDPTSHDQYLNNIQRLETRLQDVYKVQENEWMEYIKYRLENIDLDGSYTREYPSFRCAYNIFSGLPKGCEFGDISLSPHIVFQRSPDQVDIKTTDGQSHIVPLNTITSSVPQYWMNVDRQSQDISQVQPLRAPTFIILTIPSIMAWMNSSDSTFQQFGLNLNPRHHSFVMTYVDYTSKLLTFDEYSQKYPFVSRTGVYFAPTGVAIDHRKTYNTSVRRYTWLIPNQSNNMDITDNRDYRNPKTRVLNLFQNNPTGELVQSTRLLAQCFGFNSIPVQNNPIPIGPRSANPKQTDTTLEFSSNQTLVSSITGNTRDTFSVSGVGINSITIKSGNRLIPNTGFHTTVSGNGSEKNRVSIQSNPGVRLNVHTITM